MQQSSFYGYTGLLPKRYTQGVMTGESEYRRPPRAATHCPSTEPQSPWLEGTFVSIWSHLPAHLEKAAQDCVLVALGLPATWGHPRLILSKAGCSVVSDHVHGTIKVGRDL